MTTTTTLTQAQKDTILHNAIHSAHKDVDYLLEGVLDEIRSGVADILGTDNCDDEVDALIDCVIFELRYEL